MPLSLSTHRRLAIAAIGLYWIILFALTHLPGDPRPEPPGRRLPHLDKVVHAAAFAGLAFLTCIAVTAFRPVTPLVLVGVAAVLASYAALDELTQGWVRFRVPDYRDWLADIVGMVVGLGAFVLARWKLASRSARVATAQAMK